MGMDAFNALYSTTYNVDQRCSAGYHENFKKFMLYAQRRTSSKAKTEQGKYSKYVLSGLLVCAEYGIEGFDEGMVRQTVASITVLDADRLSVRFKDGTEIEQSIPQTGRSMIGSRCSGGGYPRSRLTKNSRGTEKGGRSG